MTTVLSHAARSLLPVLAVTVVSAACHQYSAPATALGPTTEATMPARTPAPVTAVHSAQTSDPAPVAAPNRLAYMPAEDIGALPVVSREFRGVWIATVGNMDWPSRRDLTTAQAQRELLRLLDAARDLGLNAVIFQVRPMADALYDSPLEPWSDYLTGASGVAPEPFWDPLRFAIDQAHARGLELHAWFNPFRAGFVAKKAPLSSRHVSRRRPDLVRRYGSFYWLDPGEPDARRQAIDVITDVVRRYDVDAVHIDDYFYPYQERDARGRLIDFPDDASWEKYGRASGLSRGDWRRSNVDTFVQQMYAAVRREKQYVRVGISPFGIWRPGYPATVRGLDSYSELFADSRKWLLNGWADYYAPQLYWPAAAPQQPYVDLVQWWSEQNPHGRHIWPGNIPNSVADGARNWRASEIIEQIRLTRAHPGATGNIHFSASSLLRNPDGLSDAFRSRVYASPALVPASPWLAPGRPPRPQVTASPDEGLHATLVRLDTSELRPQTWVVHARWIGEWQTLVLTGATREVYVDSKGGQPPDALAIIAFDRAGVASEPTLLQLRGQR
jgi:uncharacterized lipoprotein YddW (UPF0748 family)